MPNARNSQTGKSKSKVWPAVVVLLSLFSFGGIAIDQPQQKQIAQTELICPVHRNTRRIHSFTKKVEPVRKTNDSFHVTAEQITSVVLLHAKLIQVKMNDALEKMRSFNTPSELKIPSSIPHRSDEDSFNSFRG